MSSVRSTGPARPAHRNTLACTSALVAGAVKPDKVRLFAEPDQLPPRVLPVLLRNQCARRRLDRARREVLHRLPVDQAAERAAPSAGTPARQQRRAPRRAARPSNCASTRLAQPLGQPRRRHAQCRWRRPATSGPSGETVSAKCAVSGLPVWKIHLQRAHQPLAIARLDARAPTAGSTRAHHPMQRLDARAARDRLEPRAQLGVLARARETARASARGSRSRCRRPGSAPARARGCRRRPRAASRAKCAAVYSSVGSAMSIR